MSSVITPSVGRKVWFWPNGNQRFQVFNPAVPCDATVIFPWNDRCVNLAVRDHAGNVYIETSVTLVQGDEPAPTCQHATWMPYQKGQAAKAETAEAATKTAA